MTTSADIVSHVMSWFRFAKQFEYVADEFQFGMYRADVVGANQKEFVEVEVKVSIRDLHVDFKSKGHKHQKYESAAGGVTHGTVPNRFYFAVPKRLQEPALEVILSKAPNYGLIVMDDTGERILNFAPWKLLSVTRRATWIHRDPPAPRVLTSIVNRMGSDLASFHMMRNRFGSLFDHVRDQSDRFIEAQPLSSLDLEDILLK